MQILTGFSAPLNVVVIGASGGIGSAFVEALMKHDNVARVYALSRSHKVFDSPRVTSGFIDITIEDTIAEAAKIITDPVNLVIIATGILHDDTIKPEKSLRDLSIDSFSKVFAINTFGPALVAKYFVGLLPREGRSVFAAISARVGSISDNYLGGWYAYRASKTALNMIIKTTSIEVSRRNKEAIIIGLHPNTVQTGLSRPFHGNVDHEIFTPEQSVLHMLSVLNNVSVQDTGKIFAWDGGEIPP